MKSADPFYKTKRWERLRQAALKRDGYVCQLSKRYGIIREAEMVHHILPRKIFPEYQWCLWNLISLSNKEHDKLHYRSGDDLTNEGKNLIKRLATSRGLDLSMIFDRLEGSAGR